jgi:hypothetical protein
MKRYRGSQLQAIAAVLLDDGGDVGDNEAINSTIVFLKEML